MRKQRQRDRRAHSHGDDVESSAVEPGATEERSLASGPVEEDLLETDIAAVSDSKPEPSHDLDSLGQEIERSLAGGGSSAPQSAQAQSNAAAPPSRNATPEDILGLQTQLYEQVEETRPAKDPEESPAKSIAAETGGPPPMEAFEERAAMAKEVLRATSDQPRRSRRAQKVETAGEEPPVESEDVADENVRFSEDLTISAKKRPRRKLFGR